MLGSMCLEHVNFAFFQKKKCIRNSNSLAGPSRTDPLEDFDTLVEGTCKAQAPRVLGFS